MNMLGFNPWVIIGAGVLAISLFVGGYWKGDHDASASYELSIAKTREATQKIVDAEAVVADVAATKLETGNAQSRIVYKTITQTVDRIVERPVYSGTCLDDDGLQLANAALAGVAAAPAGKPVGTVPGPVTPR